jgi:hypothetical protein
MDGPYRSREVGGGLPPRSFFPTFAANHEVP